MSILAVPCTNYGTLRKSSGTGVSIVSNAFLNAGGTIQVDSGQLVLEQANFGGGLFKIAAGASVALENSYYYMINPGWSGQLDGAGGGQILLKDFNTVLGGHPPLTLNFPPGMFWFTGGALDGLITNINTIIIWATNNPRIQNAWSGSSGIYNAGLMQQTNGGTLDGYYGGKLINLTNGVYDFAGDGGTLAVPFGNYGTVRKSSGTDVSTISGSFTNIDGTIEVDSGRLSLINGNSYAQGSGALNIVLGGSGAGQSGSFDISGSASLGGQLIVSLTNS